MTRIYIPAHSIDDWRRLLDEPENNWEGGHSVKRLAQAWMEAGGDPPAVRRALHRSRHEDFRDMEILLAVPCYEAALLGNDDGERNDLFVLGASRGQLTAFMVEGSGGESFGPKLSEWRQSATPGRKRRLAHICGVFGFDEEQVADIRYRILSCAAAALIEAGRFNAPNAVMLVHSFSRDYAGSADFTAFAKHFGLTPEPNHLHFVGYVNKKRLFLGWIADV